MLLYILAILVLIVIYWNGVRTFGYWKERGIKHDVPLPYVGTNLKQYLQKASIGMMAAEAYKKYPEEKVVGYFRSTAPELVIRDPEIIKRILTTDFQHFYARGLKPHRTVIEPMLRNLFFADGDLWRLLRQRITPTFSTGKLKAMFPYITERAEKMQSMAEKISNDEGICDVRELMARYTTDFIGVCGFGLNMDTLSEENSEFRKLGQRIFTRTLRDAVAAVLKRTFPELTKHLTLLDPCIEKSMVHLVRTVARERNYLPSEKNDFIDLLLEVKRHGSMIGESMEEKNADGTPKIVEIEVDDLLMAAQVFVFFGAGFETSSSSSSYTLHQFAFNPDCQRKVHKEIDTVLAKYNNKLTYYAIKEMKYLEMAFLESMRMYPSVGYIIRECSSPEYTIPELGVTIHRGVRTIIPVKALHNDAKYFENPEQFRPERFQLEVRNEIEKFVFLPFGEGPRACVGARLGLMESMAGLAAVLHKFQVEPAPNTVRNPKPDPTGVVTEGIVGGLPLRLRKRF